MRNPSSPLVPALLGVALIGIAVFASVSFRRTVEEDERGIAIMSGRLDSVRSELHLAATGADSARLVKEITERAYYLGQRTFHIPLQKERVAGFWWPTGPGTLLAGAGAFLLILAGILVRRQRLG